MSTLGLISVLGFTLGCSFWFKNDCMYVWKWKCYSLSHVWFFTTLWTVAHKPPLSLRFPKQEYWCGLPWPPPGDLPNPGIKPTFLMSPALRGGFFTSSTTWEAYICQTGEVGNWGWDVWIASITQVNGHKFEQTPGHSGVQAKLVHCSPWSLKDSDTT